MGMWDWIRDTLAVVAPPTRSAPRSADPKPRETVKPTPAATPAGAPAEESPPSRKKRKRRSGGAPKKAKTKRAPRDPNAPKKPKKPNRAKKRRPPGWSGADREERAAGSTPAAEVTTAPTLLASPSEPPEAPPPLTTAPPPQSPDVPEPVDRTRAPSSEAPPRRDKGRETLAWIVVPKLDALLEGLDTVLADTEAPRERLAGARKRFLREWKALRPIPRSDAERLSAAHDARLASLDARIAALPDPKKEEEARHVAAREALIVEAQALAGVDDLKTAITQAKALQKRWRDSARVPREQVRPLQERFKASIDAVFARREADRAARLERLSALADAGEALARTADKVRAAEAMKQLQAQWKEVGGVPGEAGDAVWKRFRGAADQVFEARRAHFEAETAANVAAREALIAEATQLAGDGVEDPDEVLRGLHRRWKRIGRVPRDQGDALWAAFREACDKVRNPPSLLPEELGDGQDTLRYSPFAGIQTDD